MENLEILISDSGWRMSLSGKVAVVTGAVMGIGKAMTEKLLQSGAKVALLDMNETEAESLMQVLTKQYGQERVLFLHCDVEQEEQVKAAFQKTMDTFGGIHILCNNAGILNESTWEKMISVNLVGVIRATYLVLEHMNKLKGGQGGVIVNTASLAGIGPLTSCPVYTASKHGVVGFTRAMSAASALSGYGVRINCLCPGFVQTGLFSNIPARLGPFSHLKDGTQLLVEKFGIVNMSQVVEAFFELVTDETKDGEALLVFQQERKYMPAVSVTD
ncbi:15-hydroxyprostaglandin dehydrogenase [NAD(+)]-like [Solea solea]|uniref:15-hydroxyprostaglandin dehydrogenase [NAD(+)]-like n=1 Tax=Solea solea TaxID=90069 RepID=UPI00272BE340|nr:15-hydroxyprostaglandin dehydrogenase [NAD(+)]-like [Solea solea]